MKIGQEGDTRPYRKLRKNDYYDTKSAVEAEKHAKKGLVKCKLCGEPITGKNIDGYDIRCAYEGST